jgi:hypothetical protein
VSGLDRVQATFSDGGGRWAMIGQVFATFNETNVAVAELDPSDGQRRQLLAVDGGEEGGSASDTPLAATFGPDGRIAVAARIQQRDEPNDTDFAVLQFSHRLTGKKLVVRDLPGVQTLSLRSKDRSVLADDPGGAADPSLHGATLTVDNPGSGERVSIALPAAMWTPRAGKRPGAVRYVYQDPAHLAGPCKKAVIKGGGSLAVACNAGLGGFTLDEATQGTLAIEMRISDAARYCFGFVASKDEPGLFVAPEASAPAGCPE